MRRRTRPGIDGSMPSGSLMPMQNGWRASGRGPPRAAAAPRSPARSIVRLRGEQSELEIDDRAKLRGRGRRAFGVPGDRVACLRDEVLLESPVPASCARPSHITVLRNFRFVVGSGRRYIETDGSGAPQR